MLRTFFLLTILGLPLFSFAHKEGERESIIKQRFSNIEFYHFDIGITTELNKNVFAGPYIGVGMGTFRNFLNARFSLGYLLGNPFHSSDKDDITSHRLYVDATVNVNLLRWQSGTFYIGGGISWNTPISNRYYDHVTDKVSTDNDIGKNHATLSGHIGVTFAERWSLQAGYVYDMSPGFNQRYVFESPNYDYHALHDRLFERGRICIGLNYQIPL